MEYYLGRVGIKVPREDDVLKLLVNLKSVFSNLEFINSMLLHPPLEVEGYDEDSLFNLPVPLSLPVTPPVFIMDMAPIKNCLPLLTYGEFQERRRMSETEEEVEVEVCAICLSNMERMEEMRELPNCSHAFHTHCLDKWMDQHHITCPTCRSNLHPLS